MQANPSSEPILTLEIKGVGPVVSFKNSKVLITKGRGGRPLPKPLLVTKAEYKHQMRKIVESFASQLLCACQTANGGMGTARLRRSLIALLLPADDSLNDIPEIHLKVERVDEGQEGALIEIQRIA